MNQRPLLAPHTRTYAAAARAINPPSSLGTCRILITLLSRDLQSDTSHLPYPSTLHRRVKYIRHECKFHFLFFSPSLTLLQIVEWAFGKRMTPAERLRKHQRSLEKTQRELDRERTKLENQEKKLVQDIKKSAKNGQMGPLKIQAKDLVRTRRYGYLVA